MNHQSIAILINAEQVSQILNISERTLWRLVSGGKLPQPVRIGRSARWRVQDIHDWIESGCPSELTKT
jgi:excisionase family DNA binding protein